jgi:hypothetical protein|tara:strand:+ start:2626 stop:3765 length:1140 start_codon:yes stop_codon:yes gene_type:complete
MEEETNNFEQNTSNNEFKKKSFAIILSATILVAIGIVGFLFAQQNYLDSTDTLGKELGENLRSGNSSQLVTLGVELETSMSDDVNAKALGKIYQATGFMYQGGPQQQQAVSLLKDVVTNTEVRLPIRVLAINAIINIYQFSAQDPVLFDLIFEDAPFAELYNGSDKELALRKLAEYSRELFPTTFANFRISIWYGAQVLNSNDLSEKEKNAHLNTISDLVNESNRLFANELEVSYALGFSSMSFYQNKAFNLFPLAVSNRVLAEEVDNAFNQAFAAYDQYHENEPILDSILPYTYLYHAIFLHILFPDGEKGSIITRDINALARIVAENKELHKTNFLTYLHKLHVGLESPYLVDGVRNLGESYSDFEEFLVENGLNFN